LAGPLEGIRVLDLTRSLAGPYCTMMLADLGADVIKVEIPATGDETRAWGPPFIGGESSYFLSVNRNKRSMTLNLKDPRGKEVLRRLASASDVLAESFRPGTAKDLGIDYDAIRRLNDRLVYCSISGFGQYGPYKDKAGYDVVAQAMGGIMSITGERGGRPVRVGVAIGDICAGMLAAYGILAALYRRSVDGRGDYVDTSLLDGQVAILTYMGGYYLATGKQPERLGTAHPSIVPYQMFKAKDDYFIVAVGNDGIWRRFCDALGLREFKEDPRFRTNPDRVRNRDELIPVLEKAFSREPVAHWLTVLEEAGVPCGPVNTLDRVFNDPHVQEREMVVKLSHKRAGEIRVTGVPVKLTRRPGSVQRPPPILGEHTEEILSEIGYDRKQIDEFRSKGVV